MSNLDDIMAELRDEIRERDHEDKSEFVSAADRVMNADMTDGEYEALQSRRAERARLRKLGFRVNE